MTLHAEPTAADDAVDATEPLVELRDVSVDFAVGRGLRRKTRHVRAVDHVDLKIGKGRTLGLVGETGSGKSTIAHLIMGMIEPTSGKLFIAGRDISQLRGSELRAHRRRVQVVLQDPYSSLDPRMRVEEIIAEPLTLGRRRSENPTATRMRVEELLGVVGLSPAKARLYPHQFSGGQRQRIAIALALAPKPDLIVLDEPTSALDVSVRAQILNVLKDLQSQLGVTLLVISHDLVSVAYLSFTVAVMHLGRIVEIGPASTIYSSPRHPYTLLLLASAPNADGTFLSRPRRATPAPSPGTTGAAATVGCSYYRGCDLRRYLGDPKRCMEEQPALLPSGSSHAAACHFSDRVSELRSLGSTETVESPNDVSESSPA